MYTCTIILSCEIKYDAILIKLIIMIISEKKNNLDIIESILFITL